jgi:hypothetical protein
MYGKGMSGLLTMRSTEVGKVISGGANTMMMVISVQSRQGP